MTLPQLNNFQEGSLLELAKGKSHLQVAKDLGRSTVIVKYHKEKFFRLGLLEVVNGKIQRTKIPYEVVPEGKLVGTTWREQFNRNWELKHGQTKINRK